jgi:cytidylate kinase
MNETIEVKDDVRHVMTHIIALGTRAVQEGRDPRSVRFVVSPDTWDRLMLEAGPSLRDERRADEADARLRLYASWGATLVEVDDTLPPGRVELWVRHVTTVVAR